MSEYLLMNKYSPLLLFSIRSDEWDIQSCKELERYTDDELMPPGFRDIQQWIDRRNYAKHKRHLQKWLKTWQLDTIKGFLDVTHALGLNDTLWVRRADDNLTWDNVSLYSNSFNDVVAKTAFSKGLQGLHLSSTSPEFTSEGSFEKCWLRDCAGNIVLYKKGSEGFINSGREPYSEFYSAQLSTLLCRSALTYDLLRFKGHLVSSCPIFTDEHNGFVPIYKYLDTSSTYHFAHIIDFLAQFGFDDDFRDMIILDAVILNTDRHFGNFGFIVDNDTFRIKRFAPVFDHNMALVARGLDYSMRDDADFAKFCGHKIGAGADFVRVAKAMLTPKSRNILHSLLDFTFTRHKSYNLPEKRLHFLNT